MIAVPHLVLEGRQSVRAHLVPVVEEVGVDDQEVKRQRGRIEVYVQPLRERHAQRSDHAAERLRVAFCSSKRTRRFHRRSLDAHEVRVLDLGQLLRSSPCSDSFYDRSDRGLAVRTEAHVVRESCFTQPCEDVVDHGDVSGTFRSYCACERVAGSPRDRDQDRDHLLLITGAHEGVVELHDVRAVLDLDLVVHHVLGACLDADGAPLGER